MNQILALREKRAKAWEAAKAFFRIETRNGRVAFGRRYGHL